MAAWIPAWAIRKAMKSAPHVSHPSMELSLSQHSCIGGSRGRRAKGPAEGALICQLRGIRVQWGYVRQDHWPQGAAAQAHRVEPASLWKGGENDED
jgi:hypothetical protein